MGRSGTLKGIRLRKFSYNENIYPLGLDVGPKGFQVIDILEDGYMIWKNPGHSYWAGRFGPRAYARTRYLLVKVWTEIIDEREWYFYDEIWEEEYRGKVKTKNLLMEKYYEIGNMGSQ